VSFDVGPLACMAHLLSDYVIRTPYGISLSITTAKTPFLSSPLISLRLKSIKGFSYTRTNISAGRGYLMDMLAKVR
jgi:hypothetical protein